MFQITTDPTRSDNYKRFATICVGIKRIGISDFLNWLSHTDFITAPASTKYHEAYAGGLLEHSLNVYDRIIQLDSCFNTQLSPESMTIVSLFHDVCKVNCYSVDYRNQKTYLSYETKQELKDLSQLRSDAKGEYIWESVPTYRFVEKDPYGGHGSKSVFYIMRHMPLTFEEASAINAHMGAYEDTTYGKASSVYEWNRLAFLLHLADESATFLPMEEYNADYP